VNPVNGVVELTIFVPRRVVERAKELGLDLESVAIEAFLRELKLDSVEEAETRLELATGPPTSGNLYSHEA